MSEGSMQEDDGEEPWSTPSNLLDHVELGLHRIIYDGASDEAEVLLIIVLPHLREALHKAGLDIPLYGEWSHDNPANLARRLMADQSTERQECEAQETAGMAEPLEVAAPKPSETALYRWWDDGDILLYVGVSGDLGNRTKGHVKGSSWMEFAAKSTVERHPSRAAALAAEEAAIRTERPLFNFQHNNAPEARRRLVEYLLTHDRADLLVPAVSRG